MRVTKSVLNRFWWKSYEIISEEKVTKVVYHPIPFSTGFSRSNQFPQYLKGYEDYYERIDNRRKLYLKEQYQNCRPQYAYTVTYTIYDVEWKDYAKQEIARRYASHKKNMEFYARLME